MIKQTDVNYVREQGCTFDIMTKLGLLRNLTTKLGLLRNLSRACIPAVKQSGIAKYRPPPPPYLVLVLYVIPGRVV
jgi:hypothetical protein